MPRSTPDATVSKLARAAASRRKAPTSSLSWSAALAEAPLPATLRPAWETHFRREYAAQLVELGHAKKAGASSGRYSGVGGTTSLSHRKVYQTELEFTEQDAQAKASGLTWSSWARRKLSR